MTPINIHGVVRQSDNLADTVELLDSRNEVLARGNVAPDGQYQLKFTAPLNVAASPTLQFPRLAEYLASTPQRDSLVDLLRARGYVQLDEHSSDDVLISRLVAADPLVAINLEQNPDADVLATKLRFFSSATNELVGSLKYPIAQADNEVLVDFETCPLYKAPETWDYEQPRPGGLNVPRFMMMQQYLADPKIGDLEYQDDWYSKFSYGALHQKQVYGVCLVRMLEGPLAEQLTACPPDMDLRALVMLGTFVLGNPGAPLVNANAGALARATSAKQVQSAVHNAWRALYPGRPELSEPRPRDARTLTQRVLNGMCPAYFQREPGSSDLWVAFAWPVTPGTAYVTPAVRARFTTTPGPADGPEYASIELAEIRHRWTDELETVVTPSGSEDSDFTPWGYAKRLLRIGLLMAGEIDCHISRGHLLAEQYQIALWRALTAVHASSDPAAWAGDAIYQLLAPHIHTTADINNYGNPLIFDPTSVFCSASGLTHAVYAQALRDQLGALDWRGWQPRTPVCPEHHYAQVARLYHKCVVDHVHAHFAASPPDERVWQAMSNELVSHAPPVPAWLPAHRSSLRPGDAAEFTGNTAGTPSMSPVRSIADLEQLCVHAIFHATFFHGWVNDRQVEDGGDVLAASFGLRSPQPPPANPAAQPGWLDSVSPAPAQACFQLFLADTLSSTQYGYFTEYSHPRYPALDALKARLVASRLDFTRLGTPIDKIRALINI